LIIYGYSGSLLLTMLMIRFQRIGRKNDPAFRIAVLEKTSGPKAGKYVDLAGSYNPKTKATTVQGDKIKAWVAKGAQISPTVMNLLIREGVYEGKMIPAVSKKNLEKNKAKNEAAAAAVIAAEEAAKLAAQEAAAAAKAAEAEAKAAAEAPVAQEAGEVAPVEEFVPPAAEEVAVEEAVSAE
jgi:small subunit ribosomal protein S16